MLLRTSRGHWLLTSLTVLLLAILAAAQEGPKEVQGEKWALIVGISDYQNVNDLRFADDDAQAMYDLLTGEAGFHDDAHSILLLNELATKHAIVDALERNLPQAKPDDLVLIYFSGHGSFVEDADGDEEDEWDETLVPYDAVLGDEGSMIIDDEFGYKVGRLRSEQVLIILDTCYSGGAGKTANVMGIRGEPADTVVRDLFATPEAGAGRLLMAASQPHEVAHEREELAHGLFTYYLLEGLSGPGDADRDGAVTAQEAFAYAREEVAGYVRVNGLTPSQTPLMEDQLTRGVIITYVGCPELIGVITAIVGNREQAVEGDRVLINLGSKDGVQPGDLFEVYHEFSTRAGEPLKEVRGRLEVIELVAENRSLCKVIESRVSIEVGDKVRRLCEFEPHEAPVERRALEITSIDFPSRIPSDGTKEIGTVQFTDDGDVNRVTFEVVDAVDFEPFEFNLQDADSFSFNEQAGTGSFQFYITCNIEQEVTLRTTLFDAAGNESDPWDFSFECPDQGEHGN